jgi:transposase-like protein
MSLRKVIKNRGPFPNDEAATKLLYLALRNAANKVDNGPQSVETGYEPVRCPVP